jgi:hypothetical protein
MPDTTIEDAEHQKFMAVAPQLMALANRVVETHVPSGKQSFEQAEELYGLLDDVIAKWVLHTGESRGWRRLLPVLTSQPRDWFRRRLDGFRSMAKPTT